MDDIDKENIGGVKLKELVRDCGPEHERFTKAWVSVIKVYNRYLARLVKTNDAGVLIMNEWLARQIALARLEQEEEKAPHGVV
jgi:hypothetical protein